MVKPTIGEIDELLRSGETYAIDWPAEDATSEPAGKLTQPKAPPATMPVDIDKWNGLTRAERRALVRHHNNLMKG